MSNKDDLTARVKGFNEKLMPLLKEFKLGLGASPIIVDGLILAKPNLFDDSKEESKVEPAPAEAEDGKKEPGISAA